MEFYQRGEAEVGGPHQICDSLSCAQLTQLSELAAPEMALNLEPKIKGEERKCWCGGLQ